jgi:protein-tyrosine phosphatase
VIQIIDGLYLGNREAAQQRERLVEEGVTHILNCTRELPCYHQGEFTYLQLHLLDPDPCFHEHLEQVCAFIDAGRQHGKVLVHCFAAVSRSPSAVLAYLCHQGATLEEAAVHLGRIIWTYPDAVFLQQLAQRHGLSWSEELRERLYESLLGRSGWDSFPG